MERTKEEQTMLSLVRDSYLEPMAPLNADTLPEEARFLSNGGTSLIPRTLDSQIKGWPRISGSNVFVCKINKRAASNKWAARNTVESFTPKDIFYPISRHFREIIFFSKIINVTL